MTRFFANLLAASLVCLLSAPVLADNDMKPFIDQLMKRMTLEEKAGQLGQYGAGWADTGPQLSVDLEREIRAGRVGSLLNVYTPKGTRTFQEFAVNNSRLKIPLLFAYDVIHGHRTIFPIPLAESASWDLPAIEKSARIAATEAAADGLHWTFAPMVDIARDPRWGRVLEGAGEDPWLGSQIAAARVRGFRGQGVGSLDSVLSTVKHFAAYGAALAGRDYQGVDMSLRELLEVYLPPYRAAVEAGADTVMTSFNDIAGVPSSSNRWLLKDQLRDTWGFKGFVVSDWTSVQELIEHGVVVDGKDAARAAFNAGLDMDMSSDLYAKQLPALVREGKVSLQDLDRSVRRVLEAKYRLGLFKDPFRFSDEKRAQATMLAPAHLEHARDMGRKSIVLLQNRNAVLPLSRSARIAVIGPLVENKVNNLGAWSGAGDGERVVSLKEGLLQVAGPNARLSFAKGAHLFRGQDLMDQMKSNGRAFDDDPRSSDELRSAALAVARDADVIVAALGESREFSGEAASLTRIHIPDNQLELLRALKILGKPIVLVLSTGRPLALEEEVKLADSVLLTWFLGTRAGESIADVLFGDYNPSGKLPITFPRNEGQIPIYYAKRNSGRPMDPTNPDDWWKSRYLDAPNAPLFPFGFGLSYTEFTYGKPTIDKPVLRKGEAVRVSVTVTNTGKRAGAEVVQLYTRDLVASISQPIKLLKGFQKIVLQPGEAQTVTFALREDQLRFVDANHQWISEPGKFKAMVGPNSSQLQDVVFELQ